MRIVNVIQCANLGGMEQASLRLMRALIAKGARLRLISLNPISGLGPLLEQAGIPAQGLDYARMGKLAAAFALQRALKAEPAEALIMTGHNFAASLALGDVCKGRRLLANHFHHEGVMQPWRWWLIYSAAKAAFRAITFPSDYVRLEAEALYPPIRPIAHTIRNPLDSPPRSSAEQRAAFRARCGVEPTAPLIGNAGWLIPRKRFDVFLDTAAAFARIHPAARFVIAGDGELRDRLRAQALQLGLQDRVQWLGWQTDLAPFYAGIDALLFNTDWDTFPTTPIEAMANAVPVVASSLNGGLPEILDPSTGWLFPHHDPSTLADALLCALSEEGRSRAMRARRRVASVSDPEIIASQIERLLYP
jgi:glycosyltransferase involved in cell wall biosynthesis